MPTGKLSFGWAFAKVVPNTKREFNRQGVMGRYKDRKRMGRTHRQTKSRLNSRKF